MLQLHEIASPHCLPQGAAPTVTTGELQQGITAGEMGSSYVLRSSDPEALMSALGQKQTSEQVRAMFAFPPKADIAESDWYVRFVPVGSRGSANYSLIPMTADKKFVEIMQSEWA
jgi:hypothetical protein